MSRYDKIEYITDNMKYLNRNDLIDIRDIIIENNIHSIKIISYGLRVDLECLNDETLEILYRFIDINSSL